MPTSPVVVNERLHALEPPAGALGIAAAVMAREGGEVEQLTPTTLVATSGSRMARRVRGRIGRGARGLPVVVRVEVSPAGRGAVLDVRMTSDEGWYLFRLPAVEDAYCTRFRRILADLHSAGLISARGGLAP